MRVHATVAAKHAIQIDSTPLDYGGDHDRAQTPDIKPVGWISQRPK